MAKQRNESDPSTPDWMAVIARCLAYLSLRQAQIERPQDFQGVLEKVNFLEGLGLPQEEAALAVGSTLNSVQVMRSRSKGTKRGKAKKRR